MGTDSSKSSSRPESGRGLLESVRATIDRYGMIVPGETVVVGVSGGADSVALLHALWRLRDELETDLVVAHLNHGIRGADADADAEFVRELAARLGLASIIRKVDVPRLRSRMRVGLEEAARKVRYDFLESAARNCYAAKIAVGHTADDQVETVLLNIIRGTGPDGLAGMPPVRGKIIRPLIDTLRAEVLSYLRENDLEWRIDASNLDLQHSRNRVRLRLIPYLEEEFNPSVKSAILSLSKLARDETALAQSEAERTYRSVTKSTSEEEVVLDPVSLQSCGRAMQRRCIRMAIEAVKGDLRDVEFEQVERIIENLDRGMEFSLTLPSGRVYADSSSGVLRIFRLVRPRRIEVVREVRIPGRTDVPELGIAIETSYVDPAARPGSRMQAVIDPSKLAGPLIARTWKPGDRIMPLGMRGQKKLQDVFTDRKVPRRERVRAPVFVDDEKTVWVAGVVVSELVKVTEATAGALRLEVVESK